MHRRNRALRFLTDMATSIMFIIYSMRTAECRCISEAGRFHCPYACQCETSSNFHVTVNCSHRGLIKIPHHLPENTTILLLNENNIDQVTRHNLQGCSMLVKLNMSYNQLLRHSFRNGSFAGAVNLEELYIHDNRIDTETMPADLLDHTRRLRVLHIHSNMWSNAKAYNDAFFAKLANLEELSLDAIPKIAFSTGFSRLLNLKNLIVRGGLQHVSNNTFAAFSESRVNYLQISAQSQLRTLEPNAFKHFRHLETLELSGNRRIGLDGISRAWFGLQFTNISELRVLRIHEKKRESITESFFKYLDQTKITSLVLVNNNIVNFASNLSALLPYLTHVDLSHNRLWDQTNVDRLAIGLERLQNLTFLDLSYQISGIPWYSDEGDTIVSEDDYYEFATVENTVDMNKNSASSIDSNKFVINNDASGKTLGQISHQGTWRFTLPPNLETINLRYSFIIHEMPEIIFSGGTKLRNIDLRENKLRRLTHSVLFSMPVHISKIDLAGNKLESLSLEVFRASASLGCTIAELNLSNNQLGNQISRDENGDIFRNFRNLTEVSLSKNNISVIPQRFFRSTPSIEAIDLSRNNIHFVDFNPANFYKLTFLNLSYNQVEVIPSEWRNEYQLKMSRGVGGLRIDLSNNPLSCSCENVAFVHWMHLNKEHFVNYAQYRCTIKGTVTANLGAIIPDTFSYDCYKILAVKVAGSLVGILIFLLTVSIYCYRCRWELRYSCLRLTDRSKQYQRIIDQSKHYDYDAFVVYDSGDRLWVNRELLPHLEDEDVEEVSDGTLSARSIRLCIHERDFPPGEDILGNIWSRMERSRKTILVLSKSFAKSNYCNYEVQLARMNSVEQARNLIIPVLLEPLDVKEMSECVSWVVRKLTYIEWPRHESERAGFWRKMHDVVIQ